MLLLYEARICDTYDDMIEDVMIGMEECEERVIVLSDAGTGGNEG